jgi:hypothetical protein
MQIWTLFCVPMLALVKEQFFDDMLFLLWHQCGCLLDWMPCILPDVAMMIKAEKMGMEYGGDVGGL